MKSMLIIAHGSRRESSNEEVRRLSETIGSNSSEFALVDCAFLELAEPSIPQGLESCIARGAKEVVIMPYFLAAGRHVVEDIPEEVAPIQHKYQDIKISITTHLGASQQMASAILNLAGNHVS